MPKVKLNRSGMRALLNDDGVRDDLTRRMQPVEAYAVGNAPVETGEYRDKIHIVQDTTDRVAVRLVADAPHSLVVEAATGNLARALDQAG